MLYYDENASKAIFFYIGTLVKINNKIALATRGKFTRVCIEIDLNRPLIGRILLKWQIAKYEGLHTVYFSYD